MSTNHVCQEESIREDTALQMLQISPNLQKKKLTKGKSKISEIGSKSEAAKDEKRASDET